MKFTVLGCVFETNDARFVLNENGDASEYPLGDCYLKMDSRESLAIFPQVKPGDRVAFYGPFNAGLSDREVFEAYLLIRDGRIVGESRLPGSVMDD